MKMILNTVVALMILTATMGSTVDKSAVSANNSATVAGKKIEVYYFHFTRRCATCNAVESVTLDALKAYYPEKFKTGEITFKSLNLEEDNSKPMAEKLKVEGQQLLFVCNNKVIDLTDNGFMYALNKPEKLKAEVKKTVEQLLK